MVKVEYQNQGKDWLLFFFFSQLHDLRGLISLIRDGTPAPAVKTLSSNHWTSREFPGLAFKINGIWTISYIYHKFLP